MSSLEADNKYLKKSAILNISGTILKVCGPLLTFVLARIFDVAEFGIFVSTQMLLLTISRSATLGLDKGLYWFLPQNAFENRPRYTGIMESFWVSIFIGFLCTLVIFIGTFAGAFEKELPWYALSIVFYVGSYIFSNTSESNRKPQNAIFINSFLVAVLAPLSSIALHYLGIPHALPLGLLIGQISGFSIHAILVKKQFPEMPFVPKKLPPKKLLIYSIPLGFNEFVASFLVRSGLWMVMRFCGAENAGAYAIMVTVSNGIQTIRIGFAPILTPVVAGMNKERLHTDLKPVFTYCVSMVTFIQLLIGFFIVLFPSEILSIAGSDYIVQPEALGILLFAQLLAGFFGMTITIINGIGKSLYTLKMNICCLAVALISGFILVPRFGLTGAALSALAHNVFSMVWNNIYLAKLGLWPYTKKLIPQIIWMVALIALYIALNTEVIVLNTFEKIALYIFVLAGLGAPWLLKRNKKSNT